MTCKEVTDMCNGNMDSTSTNGLNKSVSFKPTAVTIETHSDSKGSNDSEAFEAEKSLEEFADDLLSNPYNDFEDVGTIARRGLVHSQGTMATPRARTADGA